MADLLKPGQELRSRLAGTCKVRSFIGAGGQGEVWLVDWQGGQAALKWYHPHTATLQQRKAIELLVSEGSPGENFLWPLDFVEEPGGTGFGYVMDLRPKNYCGLTDLVGGRISPRMRSVVSACLEVARAYRQIHTRGLCYCDINFGNVFLDPATGKVLICDNDNVTVNRSPDPAVFGTADFMAPEIVLSQASPSTITDLHSLAILLFYMLHIGHPLQGRRMLAIRCWDAPARTVMYGQDPVFIFDPNDRRNVAVSFDEDPDAHFAGGWPSVYWAIYPSALRSAFTRAFTDGLRDTNARITELEWQGIFSEMLDSMVRCKCGSPNFIDHAADAMGEPRKPCWNCAAVYPMPHLLRIGRHIITLDPENLVFPHHLGDGHSVDPSVPIAKLRTHPTAPGQWGLQNLTKANWTAQTASGEWHDIGPDRSVRVASGVKINFGRAEGEIL